MTRLWRAPSYTLSGRWADGRQHGRTDRAQATSAQNLGHLNLLAGLQPGIGHGYYHQALELARQKGDWRKEIEILMHKAATVHHEQKDYEREKEGYQQALKLAKKHSDRRIQVTLLGNLGNVFFHQEDHAQAKVHYEKAVQLAHKLGDQKQGKQWLANLGAPGGVLEKLENHAITSGNYRQLGTYTRQRLAIT